VLQSQRCLGFCAEPYIDCSTVQRRACIIQEYYFLPIVMSVFLVVGTVHAVEPSALSPDRIIERYRSLLCSGQPPAIESVQRFADGISATGTLPHIDGLIARQEGDGPPLAGYRHFPQADFTAYHRPTASVILKTAKSNKSLQRMRTNRVAEL